MWHPLPSPFCVAAMLLFLQQAASGHANGTGPGHPARDACPGPPLAKADMAGSLASGRAQAAPSAPSPRSGRAEAPPRAWRGGCTATATSQGFRDVARGDEEGDGGPAVAFIAEEGARPWRQKCWAERGAIVVPEECCFWSDAAGRSGRCACWCLALSLDLLYYRLILPACKVTGILVAILTGIQLLARCMKRYQSWHKQQSKEGWPDSPLNRTQGAADHPLCAICLQAYKPREALKLLSCSHAYHGKCIDMWHRTQHGSKTCPLCLRSVTAVLLIPLHAHNREQE